MGSNLGHQGGYICVVGLKHKAGGLYWNKGPWLIEGVKALGRYFYFYFCYFFPMIPRGYHMKI